MAQSSSVRQKRESSFSSNRLKKISAYAGMTDKRRVTGYVEVDLSRPISCGFPDGGVVGCAGAQPTLPRFALDGGDAGGFDHFCGFGDGLVEERDVRAFGDDGHTTRRVAAEGVAAKVYRGVAVLDGR